MASKTCAYRHNIAKHADATHATMYLIQQDGNLVLLIEDNGRGFDTDEGRNATAVTAWVS